MSVDRILADRNRYQDSVLQSFEAGLRQIMSRAQASVLVDMTGRLAITDGSIERTLGNVRALRNIDAMFTRAMDEAGYSALLETFVGQFPQQLSSIQQILEDIIPQLSARLNEEIRPFVLTARDKAALLAEQSATVDQLRDVVEYGATVAKQKALLSVGGMTFRDLSDLISDQCDTTAGNAKTLADTSMNVFYRTANERAFELIERDIPEIEQKYEYAGPLDDRNRPFCRKLMRARKAYTRAEIDQMDNGNLPNVWLTAGGFRCRHCWIISTKDLEERRRS